MLSSRGGVASVALTTLSALLLAAAAGVVVVRLLLLLLLLVDGEPEPEPGPEAQHSWLQARCLFLGSVGARMPKPASPSVTSLVSAFAVSRFVALRDAIADAASSARAGEGLLSCRFAGGSG